MKIHGIMYFFTVGLFHGLIYAEGETVSFLDSGKIMFFSLFYPLVIGIIVGRLIRGLSL